MNITYFRSSSYNRWDWCNLAFYAEYCLGWIGPSNQKAEKGTIVHKCLEEVAKNQTIVDITDLCVETYNNHIKTSIHQWSDQDLEDCIDWVYKTITYNNGRFDPRNREIVKAEGYFDFEIQKPWAYYKYGDEEGFLSVKGTIDLICKIDDKTYEIIDYKTGRRVDWNTGEEKTYNSLKTDPQLLIYYYAARYLYPEIENFIVTIFYINDGGPYTINFDKSDLKKIEDMLRRRFVLIKETTHPQQTISWRCKKLCHLGKTTFQETNMTPLIEFRENQICPMHTTMTKCEQIFFELNKNGFEKTTAKYTNPKFNIDKYSNK